jgi:hypothetical protein
VIDTVKDAMEVVEVAVVVWITTDVREAVAVIEVIVVVVINMLIAVKEVWIDVVAVENAVRVVNHHTAEANHVKIDHTQKIVHQVHVIITVNQNQEKDQDHVIDHHQDVVRQEDHLK